MLYEFQRNGADFSVFVNTAAEFDGSDAGASPDEAVSWGKIKKTAKPVKVSKRCLFIPKQMNSSSINTMYWLEMEIEALTYQIIFQITMNLLQVYGEATLIFPLLVAETFARRENEFLSQKEWIMETCWNVQCLISPWCLKKILKLWGWFLPSTCDLLVTVVRRSFWRPAVNTAVCSVQL